MERVTSCDEAMDRRIAELESELSTLRRSVPGVSLKSLWQLFYDSNIVPLARAKITGEILDCNQAYCDMVGYTREELLSGTISWNQLTPPEYNAGDEECVRQIRATGRAIPYEKEYVHKDGSRISIIIACTATDVSGENVFCLFVNVTEIRHAEMQLRKSEEQFRSIVDLIPQIVYICGPDGTSVEYLNKRHKDYTGQDAQAAMDQNWQNFVHPDDLPKIMETWERVRANGGVFETELRHLLKDGAFHWTLARSVPIKGADGAISKWIGTVTDIDEQKRVELQLREDEESFRLLTHAIPQIVWTATTTGEIDFFNDRWLEYTGLSVEQSLSGGWRLLVHPSDLDEYTSKWKNAVQTGETYEHEFRLKRAVGLSKNTNGYRWQLCRAVAMHNRNGKIIKWFGTWTEIDEQKKTQ